MCFRPSLLAAALFKLFGVNASAAGPRLLWWAVILVALLGKVRAEDYTYTTNNGAITITQYRGPGGVVTIPSTINGLPVISIGSRRSPTTSVG